MYKMSSLRRNKRPSVKKRRERSRSSLSSTCETEKISDENPISDKQETSDEKLNSNVTIACSSKDKCHENDSTVKHVCSVCFEECIQPVQLPCSHIFCFLCMKGLYQYTKKCALCRQVIPKNYFAHLHFLETVQSSEESENVYKWFYEGTNGWWQYDDRTSAEIEEAFLDGSCSEFQIMVAGSLYCIDFINRVQVRKDFPFRKRRIKRDLGTVPKKGIAGVKRLL